MTVHYIDQDTADDAAVDALEITEIEITPDDYMTLDEWVALLLRSRDVRRRALPGVDLVDGTDATGRMFRATVVGDQALVEFLDFVQRAGTTGSAANDDRHGTRSR